MPTDSELFHKAVKDLGGQLNLDRLSEKVAAGYSSCSRSLNEELQSASDAEIYFGFIDNPEFQAWAFEYNGRNFIALNTGAVGHLRMLFDRFLSDPRILPNLGDASLERQDELASTSKGARTLLTFNEHVIPQDPDRRLVADYLLSRATRFLMYHEAAHIYHGHVRYWNLQGFPMMPEFGWQPKTASEALTQQTLEMDADSWAVCAFFRQFRLVNLDLINPPFRQFYEEPKEAAFYWAFAIMTLFRLFGDDGSPEDDYSKASHPPFSARHFMAVSTAIMYIKLRWDEALVDPLAKRMRDSVAEVERAFALVTGQRIAVDGMLNICGPKGQQYIKSLTDHWQSELRSKLQPFASRLLPD